MEYAKVIQFPKDKSVRKRMQDLVQEQKSALVLSIASVLLVTVFVNQWIIDNAEHNLLTSVSRSSRQIASVDDSLTEKNIKWEHDLASKLSNDETLSLSLSERPSLRDDMLFGDLQGHYGVRRAEGRLYSIEFIDTQSGEQPLAIEDKKQFLKKYSSVLGGSFVKVSLVGDKTEKSVQSYNLIDSSNTIVGQAHFNLDSEGRVQSIRLSR